MLSCPPLHVFHLPDRGKHQILTSLKWAWKGQKEKRSATQLQLMILKKQPFILERPKAWLSLCSNALRWRVAQQFYHSEPWEQASILCQTMTGRKLCLCDTWSACYGNHSSTHINTHLVSSRCLIGSTPETHTCLNCLCLLLGHLTRWRVDFIQIVWVCLSPFSWMHRLAVYEENHLTVSLISQPPPGLNTLAAQHMVAIC